MHPTLALKLAESLYAKALDISIRMTNLMATMIEAIIMGTIMPMTLVIPSERAVQLAD